ncbi:MAG: hypothetical protein RIQ89_1806 [Bacteroidota bacterium]|jgi:copper chaperone CopZ
MKKIILILSIAFIAQIATAQITKGTLQASGLTCSMCNLAIKKSLEKISFIDTIVPNVETASYELTFKEGTSVNLQEIKNAVEKAGFSVAQLSFTVNRKSLENLNNNTFTINGFTYNIISRLPINKANGTPSFYITDRGFLSEKKYKKFKSANKISENELIINIAQLL